MTNYVNLKCGDEIINIYSLDANLKKIIDFIIHINNY